MRPFNPKRRTLLKAGAIAGGGFFIGINLAGHSPEALADADPKSFSPSAWIKIGSDDSVTIIVAKSEMGQGVMTSMPMLIAEELEADWSKVRIETAPANRVYAEPERGTQFTGGSRSVRKSWDQLRRVGAAAREMLIAAAAQEWQVSPQSCRAEKGVVVHEASGRRLSYGALAEAAAKLPVPDKPALKDPKDFTIIGKPIARLDTPSKVDGSGVFGIDVKVPKMLHATVLQCPVFGGKVATFNADKAMAVKGVRQVVEIDNALAVVADSFWSAKLGRDALEVKWDEGKLAGLNSADISRAFVEAAKQQGLVARNEGDAASALSAAPKRIDAVYEVPYLAHATMEPMSCTAEVRLDGADVWAGTQSQTGTQFTTAKHTSLPPEAVAVHTTLLGGGFGRRFEQDFIAQTVQIAKAVEVPVKVIWTREEDMQHDFYRPATYNRLSAALDDQGRVVAWSHRLVAPSIFARAMPSRLGKDGMDAQAIEGAANLPYDIANIQVDWVKYEPGIPVGFWRSVGSSQNAFITECFVDELAHAAGKDPFEFRRSMLAKAPRQKAVLELAAAKAGWGGPLPEGHFRGIAVHEAFASYVAEVAEVSVSNKGEVKVHRVVCALDCGMYVNPDTVAAQMEGGIVYGLTAALKGRITIKNGRVEQSNFDDYPMLRMEEMPKIEVHILSSSEAPGGVGEPGTPPIAPAVVNAIFAATGKRIRTLPIRAEDLHSA